MLRNSARSYPEVKGEGSGLLHESGKCRVEVDHRSSVANHFSAFLGNVGVHRNHLPLMVDDWGSACAFYIDVAIHETVSQPTVVKLLDGGGVDEFSRSGQFGHEPHTLALGWYSLR